MLQAASSSLAAKQAVLRRASLPAGIPSRASVRTAAKQKLDGQGFVATDNSGRSNMFPTQSKPFISSPRSNAVAQQGLGGSQGLGILAGALVLVAVATVGVAGGNGDSNIQGAGQYDSLTTIAARLERSL